jgi:hypothetical protein
MKFGEGKDYQAISENIYIKSFFLIIIIIIIFYNSNIYFIL